MEGLRATPPTPPASRSWVPVSEGAAGGQRVDLGRGGFLVPAPLQLHRDIALREPAPIDGLVGLLEGHHFPICPPHCEPDDPVQLTRRDRVRFPPIREEVCI